MRKFVALLAVFTVSPTLGARKCEPETRCINSPDLGITSTSTFFPPIGATSEQLALFHAGMQHSADGKSCIYGHTDLNGTQRLLSETKKCYEYEGGSCGWSVTEYMCTCASKERARASYDTTSYIAGGVVLACFGGVVLLVYCVFFCRDYWNDDLELPGCECGEPGVLRFWMALLLAFALPSGFLGGAAYAFMLAARDPELPSTWGYWQGCGTFSALNPANPLGRAFISFFGLLILCMVCIVCYGLVIGPCSARYRIRTRQADSLQRELRIRAANLRQDIETASATGSSTVVPTRGSGQRGPARLALQRSAQRLGDIGLELANPTRMARSVSARRFDHGKFAPVVKAISLGTPVQTGFMIKVVPSFVGKSMSRYFVLFSADSTAMLCFYDEQKDPPESATCLGKAELSKIASVERKRLHSGTTQIEHGLELTFSSRAVAWQLDAGDEATQAAWEAAINEEVRQLASAGPKVAAPVDSTVPVVDAEVVPANDGN